MSVVDTIFNAGDKSWQTCPECKLAAPRLNTLVGKYPALKVHLENVFQARAVVVVFSRDEDAHFTATDNTITLPHSGEAKDEIDLVDAIIFESYNAIRKDQFISSKSLSDVNYDLVASGTLSAQIEAGTMSDFYDLAMSMDKNERTGNMEKCILRAKDAKGSISAHFLGSPHMGDPDKLKLLPPEDERRLPTAVMYIYQAIVNTGTVKMRAVLLTKSGVPFEEGMVSGFQGRMSKDIVLKVTAEPLKTEATALDALVKKNWTTAYAKRPGVLLKIIDRVQTDPQFATLKASITEAAFGFTSDMKNMAVLNNPGFQLK